MTVIIFILILGLLVFVHELGHFLVARRNGVKAEEFGFGFPPRIFGVYWDEKGRRRLVWGSKEVAAKGTIYSVNYIPLGGFVKILGEEGENKNDPESFAGKSPLARISILASGVIMNFLLAVVLYSVAFGTGVPEVVENIDNAKTANEKIQIVEVLKDTPAEAMGIKIGDEIISARLADEGAFHFNTIEDFQNFIKDHRGAEVKLELGRGEERVELAGTPRVDYPEDQGALGVTLAKTAVVTYPWHEAIWKGFETTGAMIWNILSGLFLLIFHHPENFEVMGPVGIASITGQFAKLGFAYLLQFAAFLSINLGIINALPFPALDGGRILFILIEKIKGSPVSQKIEQRAHSVGFALLLTLMAFVTMRDLLKLDIVDRIWSLLA